MSMLADWYNTVLESVVWSRPEHPITFRALPRDTAWVTNCNCKYEYGKVQVAPQVFTEELASIIRYVYDFLAHQGLQLYPPNCCNLNYYADGGDSVGFHADDEKLFGNADDDVPIIPGHPQDLQHTTQRRNTANCIILQRINHHAER